MWHELRECLRAIRSSLLLHTTCARSCCNWHASCVAAKQQQQQQQQAPFPPVRYSRLGPMWFIRCSLFVSSSDWVGSSKIKKERKKALSRETVTFDLQGAAMWMVVEMGQLEEGSQLGAGAQLRKEKERKAQWRGCHTDTRGIQEVEETANEQSTECDSSQKASPNHKGSRSHDKQPGDSRHKRRTQKQLYIPPDRKG